jgi:hypothetical protein
MAMGDITNITVAGHRSYINSYRCYHKIELRFHTNLLAILRCTRFKRVTMNAARVAPKCPIPLHRRTRIQDQRPPQPDMELAAKRALD